MGSKKFNRIIGNVLDVDIKSQTEAYNQRLELTHGRRGDGFARYPNDTNLIDRTDLLQDRHEVYS